MYVLQIGDSRGELSYLAPLGGENISAPYFKQCSFGGGGITPPDWVKHHPSQSQDRNNKYFILYLNFASIMKFKCNFSLTFYHIKKLK